MGEKCFPFEGKITNDFLIIIITSFTVAIIFFIVSCVLFESIKGDSMEFKFPLFLLF